MRVAVRHQSRQPLLDGARKLLKLGHDPSTLATIRHYGKNYDSFEPRPLRELARWTIKERDRAGLAASGGPSYPGQDAAVSSPVAAPAAPERRRHEMTAQGNRQSSFRTIGGMTIPFSGDARAVAPRQFSKLSGVFVTGSSIRRQAPVRPGGSSPRTERRPHARSLPIASPSS